ncbi:uncharacterized protein A1O5_12331, partial [Cladophialophora psammophila CBS 110553]
VSVVSRKSTTRKLPGGVAQLKTDYSRDSLVAVHSGQDVVISTIAWRAFMHQIRLVDAVIKVGVKRFIPSEFWSNTSNEVGLSLVFYCDQKNKVRQQFGQQKRSNRMDRDLQQAFSL